jgi:hypothetical protein
MKKVFLPVEMLQDHEELLRRSSGAMGEAFEMPKLEVP